MKSIAYAGEHLLTGDDIADAVLHYSEALAGASEAGTVDIPVLAPNGSQATATILVGPSSQIVATHVDSEFAELVDVAVVAQLKDRTRQLQLTVQPQGRSVEAAPTDAVSSIDDF